MWSPARTVLKACSSPHICINVPSISNFEDKKSYKLMSIHNVMFEGIFQRVKLSFFQSQRYFFLFLTWEAIRKKIVMITFLLLCHFFAMLFETSTININWKVVNTVFDIPFSCTPFSPSFFLRFTLIPFSQLLITWPYFPLLILHIPPFPSKKISSCLYVYIYFFPLLWRKLLLLFCEIPKENTLRLAALAWDNKACRSELIENLKSFPTIIFEAAASRNKKPMIKTFFSCFVL